VNTLSDTIKIHEAAKRCQGVHLQCVDSFPSIILVVHKIHISSLRLVPVRCAACFPNGPAARSKDESSVDTTVS